MYHEKREIKRDAVELNDEETSKVLVLEEVGGMIQKSFDSRNRNRRNRLMKDIDSRLSRDLAMYLSRNVPVSPTFLLEMLSGPRPGCGTVTPVVFNSE